jgi:hypothetical protein
VAEFFELQGEWHCMKAEVRHLRLELLKNPDGRTTEQSLDLSTTIPHANLA